MSSILQGPSHARPSAPVQPPSEEMSSAEPDLSHASGPGTAPSPQQRASADAGAAPAAVIPSAGCRDWKIMQGIPARRVGQPAAAAEGTRNFHVVLPDGSERAIHAASLTVVQVLRDYPGHFLSLSARRPQTLPPDTALLRWNTYYLHPLVGAVRVDRQHERKSLRALHRRNALAKHGMAPSVLAPCGQREVPTTATPDARQRHTSLDGRALEAYQQSDLRFLPVACHQGNLPSLAAGIAARAEVQRHFRPQDGEGVAHLMVPLPKSMSTSLPHSPTRQRRTEAPRPSPPFGGLRFPSGYRVPLQEERSKAEGFGEDLMLLDGDKEAPPDMKRTNVSWGGQEDDADFVPELRDSVDLTHWRDSWRRGSSQARSKQRGARPAASECAERLGCGEKSLKRKSFDHSSEKRLVGMHKANPVPPRFESTCKRRAVPEDSSGAARSCVDFHYLASSGVSHEVSR